MTKEYVETVDSLRRRSENAEATVLDQFKEIERMRAALTKIAKMKSEPIGDTGFMVGPTALFNACQREAKAALAIASQQQMKEPK
jgi:hypothetical protein